MLSVFWKVLESSRATAMRSRESPPSPNEIPPGELSFRSKVRWIGLLFSVIGCLKSLMMVIRSPSGSKMSCLNLSGWPPSGSASSFSMASRRPGASLLVSSLRTLKASSRSQLKLW